MGPRLLSIEYFLGLVPVVKAKIPGFRRGKKSRHINFMLCYVVLPPVLVPRNPQVITSVYEPVPSYLDSGRSSYSPNNDVQPLNFDTPGTMEFFSYSSSSVIMMFCLETPPPAYSETGSPSPPDPTLLEQLSPSNDD